jgi:methylmalonyl-CoA mutase C-terminal domain/subunit
MTHQARVVLAKVGLDGHDVGVNVVAKALVGDGFEVVYLGKRLPTAAIVSAVIAEDAAALGLSCLSGGLGHFAARVVTDLQAEGVTVPVLAGGIDEPSEIEKMLAAGVSDYFPPGTPIDDVLRAFRRATGTPRGGEPQPTERIAPTPPN